MVSRVQRFQFFVQFLFFGHSFVEGAFVTMFLWESHLWDRIWTIRLRGQDRCRASYEGVLLKNQTRNLIAYRSKGETRQSTYCHCSAKQEDFVLEFWMKRTFVLWQKNYHLMWILTFADPLPKNLEGRALSLQRLLQVAVMGFLQIQVMMQGQGVGGGREAVSGRTSPRRDRASSEDGIRGEAPSLPDEWGAQPRSDWALQTRRRPALGTLAN